MRIKVAIIAITLIFVWGCQAPQHRIHKRVLANETLVAPQGKLLVLPLNVEVKEVSASGMAEVVPRWTDQAKNNIASVLNEKKYSLLKGYELVGLPALNAQEQEQLELYVNLGKTVWLNSTIMTRFGGPAWSHKIKSYDYTVGPGLRFLAEKTGVDKGLLLIGEDVHTTAGRKAFSLLAAAFGVVVPMGHKMVVANVVDLNTGDILWSNLHINTGTDSLLARADVAEALAGVFKKYPGVTEYRKYINGN